MINLEKIIDYTKILLAQCIVHNTTYDCSVKSYLRCIRNSLLYTSSYLVIKHLH